MSKKDWAIIIGLWLIGMLIGYFFLLKDEEENGKEDVFSDFGFKKEVIKSKKLRENGKIARVNSLNGSWAVPGTYQAKFLSSSPPRVDHRDRIVAYKIGREFLRSFPNISRSFMRQVRAADRDRNLKLAVEYYYKGKLKYAERIWVKYFINSKNLAKKYVAGSWLYKLYADIYKDEKRAKKVKSILIMLSYLMGKQVAPEYYQAIKKSSPKLAMLMKDFEKMVKKAFMGKVKVERW